MSLLYKAHTLHRQHHNPAVIELASLLSIKTGGCPEDCAYCPQSSRHDKPMDSEPIMPVADVVAAARRARDQGAKRFCMGAAWRSPTARQLDDVIHMVTAIKELGLEACATLGMLKDGQAERLQAAGLDYYNHNLDTSPEFYGDIISSRTYQDRLETIARVQNAGIKVCCGGIVGMGESRRDRAALIAQLANLDPYPESVPVNALVKVAGTPLDNTPPLDPLEFVRTIAVARITMPKAVVRLSAGRTNMDDAFQALCFFAGANSIFYGEKLLTTGNPDFSKDQDLLDRLDLTSSKA